MRLHDRDQSLLGGGVVLSNSTGTLEVGFEALNISDWSSTCSVFLFSFFCLTPC